MVCEYCNVEHDSSYGSGRFCSEFCARGFSSKAKRKGINEKVSKKLKGTIPRNLFQIGHKKLTNDETYIKANATKRINREAKIRESSFEDLNGSLKRVRVLIEQDYKCNICKLEEWLGDKITFEYHHKDGNKKNEARENVEYLCPNCHSKTKYWRKSWKHNNTS